MKTDTLYILADRSQGKDGNSDQSMRRSGLARGYASAVSLTIEENILALTICRRTTQYDRDFVRDGAVGAAL